MNLSFSISWIQFQFSHPPSASLRLFARPGLCLLANHQAVQSPRQQVLAGYPWKCCIWLTQLPLSIYRSWTYFLCSSDQLHHKVAAHSVKSVRGFNPSKHIPIPAMIFYHEAGKFWREFCFLVGTSKVMLLFFFKSSFINGRCFLSKFQQSTQHLGEQKKTYLNLTMLNRNANALEKSTWKNGRKEKFPETTPHPQKAHKLPCETPNGMDLSCHRSKTHIQRCCRDQGTFALWKTGEEKSPTLRPKLCITQLLPKRMQQSWKMKDAPFESWSRRCFRCLFFGKSKKSNPKNRFTA